MALVTVPPNRIDVAIADAIAQNTRELPEEVASAVTWAADEELLLALAAIGWLATRRRGEPSRRAGNHMLLLTVTASLIPHLLKSIVDQKRPDREMVSAHRHGIPISGKSWDAFPSGHAVHMGALASAAGAWPEPGRSTARGVAVGLSLTRIFILAHWTSDVVAGFAMGILLERLLRRWTRYAKMRPQDCSPKERGGSGHSLVPVEPSGLGEGSSS